MWPSGLLRASTSSSIDWNRAALFFSRQCMTTDSIPGGTSWRSSDGSGGVLVRWATRISPKPSPWKGVRPVSIS